MAERFIGFHRRYRLHFQSRPRSVLKAAGDYLSGLMQAPANRKDMERMEEAVAGADEQQLQHMLSDSSWDHQAVMNQVALETDQQLGGGEESCLIIDESGFKKSGGHSAGVARQWCGRLGKVDNCQVGVFAALGRESRVCLMEGRLYLPREWTRDAERCRKAGIPPEHRVFKSKSQLALEMVSRQRRLGVRFSWVGVDGGYGREPGFLRHLEAMGEVFVADVHCDQRLHLEDPKPEVPQRQRPRGRKPSRLKIRTPSVRVDRWAAGQPEEAWKRLTLRDGTGGELQVEALNRRVWLWNGEEAEAKCWHLIVRREVDSPRTIRHTLSNASANTPLERLARMQARRYWVERALQDGKSECGMADCQVRRWSAWHHHMALVFMSMLFMLEERLRAAESRPLLSCSDIEELLRHFLPKRALSKQEVIAQMHKRHRKRQTAIEAAYRKQRLVARLE